MAYTLRISRLTVDKLGVKLYDKVSAVTAELIANGYDADAENVWVELPLGTDLTSKDADTGEPVDRGYEILVRDDGHGMTPEEAQDFYLQVGRDRRAHKGQGSLSRRKNRPVMGRKGIGKLAPFGICRHIELISAGGEEIRGEGFLTTHFFLDFGSILQDSDEEIQLDAGELDGTFLPESGTTVRLTSFLPKRVPDRETFHRQLATRFALADPSFVIHLRNTRPEAHEEFDVQQFQVPVREETRIDLAQRPVLTDGGDSLAVTGWLAMAREAYKNEELAGVRIYARGKIVATTRDFEQPAGFTGEYTMRSYLVGEVHADWLDDDEGDDLIRTDRQSILWDSDRGQALRAWGANLITEIAAASRGPRRQQKSAIFMEKARLVERARDRYGEDETLVEVVEELGKRIGAFAAEDELADDEYVDGLAEIVLSVAPHQALVTAFKEISQQENASIEELIQLFGKTRIAEMASYGQIADERVKSIRELKDAINEPDVQEADLQKVIASAPWLVRPDWSAITQNQQLKTFRDQFAQWWKSTRGEEIDIAISYEKKRPDFTLIHHGRRLYIVEIKTPGHRFDDQDFERLQNYVTAFREFFAAHQQLVAAFPDGWQIVLVTDDVRLSTTEANAYRGFEQQDEVVRQTWNDFLANAVTAHEEFLNAYDQAHREP